MLKLLPPIASSCILSGSPLITFAQTASDPSITGSFHAASADLTLSSELATTAFKNALKGMIKSLKSGVVTAASKSAFDSAYDGWIADLRSTGYFENFDAAARENPSLILSTSLSAQTVSGGVNILNSLGFSGLTASAYLNRLKGYQSSLSLNEAKSIAEAGSETLFAQLSGSIPVGAVAPLSLLAHASPEEVSHSATCSGYIIVGTIAALTGAEICAAYMGLCLFYEC